MVVFICDGCQESLSRGKVKAHSVKCRSFWTVSCVDCGKRFEADTYEQHISCLSESEKYTGKKEKKKDDWTECVLQALDRLASRNKNAHKGLEQILSRVGPETIPQKKQKFQNMCKSGHKLPDATIDGIRSVIEEVRKEKITQREEQKKAAQQEQQKEKQKPVENGKQSDADNDQATSKDAEKIEAQRKQLVNALKKAGDEGVRVRDLIDTLGKKKTIKRLAKSFPEEFAIEKDDEEGCRRVKLVKMSKGD